MSKEESNCIGVNIVNTGKLTDTRINRFKLAQIIKASFLVDFNTARVMINDLFEKLKDPNATYLIKGFNFSKEIFEKMEAVPPGGFVSDLGYAAVGKDALGFQVLRRGHTDKSERFERFEEVLAYILRVYW